MTFTAEIPLSDTGSVNGLADEGPLHDDQHDEQLDDQLDEFLGALTALGGSAGNGRLRETLEWDEATYETVKAELLSRRLIVPGRGRGGLVALANGSGEQDTESLGGNGQRSRAASSRSLNGSRAVAPSSLEQAFRAIDD